MHFSLVILATVLLANTVHAEEEYDPSGFVSEDAIQFINLATEIAPSSYYKSIPLREASAFFFGSDPLPIDYYHLECYSMCSSTISHQIITLSPSPRPLPRVGAAGRFKGAIGTISFDIDKDPQPVGGSTGTGANVGIGIKLGPFGFSRYQENNGIKINQPNDLESQQLNDAINA